MNSGKYLFSQLVEFLQKRIFDEIVKKYSGDKYVKTFTCWNQLLVMMFGQLSSCDSLWEVICIIDAFKNKSYHLGFGDGNIKLSNVAYTNANRDYRIFEEFPHIARVCNSCSIHFNDFYQPFLSRIINGTYIRIIFFVVDKPCKRILIINLV